MSHTFGFIHSTPENAAPAILSSRFEPGKDANNFLGQSGPYGSYLEADDIEKIAAGNLKGSVAYTYSQKFIEDRYKTKAVSLFGIVNSKLVLDLTHNYYRDRYRELCDILGQQLQRCSIVIGNDEDTLRPFSHVAAEILRLLVSLETGEPVHAIIGRFFDLTASHPANSSARHFIAGVWPREVCVKIPSLVEWVSAEQIPILLRNSHGDLFDYRDGVCRALTRLRTMTEARFVSLLLSALQPRGLGFSIVREECSRHVALIYVERFRIGHRSGHAMMLMERVNKAVAQKNATLLDFMLPTNLSPEHLSKITREINHKRTSAIVVIDRFDPTLSGLPKTILQMGLPCLIATSNRAFLDLDLVGQSNLIVTTVPFSVGNEKEASNVLARNVLGFLTADWASEPPSIEHQLQKAARHFQLRQKNDDDAITDALLNKQQLQFSFR